MMEAEGGGEMDFYTASMGNIAAMGELSLLPDDNPHITATASELNYHADFDSGFEDRNAFARVTMSVYLEEAGRLSQLVSLCVCVCSPVCACVCACPCVHVCVCMCMSPSVRPYCASLLTATMNWKMWGWCFPTTFAN